jgi:hypothetical protein
MALLGHPDRF